MKILARIIPLLPLITAFAVTTAPAISQTTADQQPMATTAPIPAGKGEQDIELNGVPFQVFTYKPDGCKISAILLVFHGAGRDAGPYRDHAIPLAQRFCMLAVAPYFDKARFPVERYQRGGIADNGKILPQTDWTVNFVAPLAAWAQQRAGTPNLPYLLIGHSAGGQFLSRVAAYTASPALEIVIANPSTWVEPDPGTPAPYGFGGLDRPEQALRHYLAAPITVLLGGIDTGSHQLAMTQEAQQQGANRLDRGQKTFLKAKQVAEQHGWAFNWRLFVVPGVDHSAARMFSSQVAFHALQTSRTQKF